MPPEPGLMATGYAYDALNRRSAESGNDAGGTGYIRNAAGDVTSVTDPRGITLAPAYDALGRLTSVSYSGSVSRSYGYVAGRSDALLASMSDPSGTSSWTYDAAGRMLTQQQTVSGVQRTVTVARDAIGRPSSITYPSGMVVGITYSADVVSSLTVNSANLLGNISYQPQSSIASGWRWGNGATYSRSFDADGRITAVALGSVQRSYGYDAAGRLTLQTDTTSAGQKKTTYAYDEAGQLISYVPPAGSGETFTYDANGNRRTQTVNGQSTTFGYVANSNRLSTGFAGTPYVYTASGAVSSNVGSPGSNGRTNNFDIYGRMSSSSSSRYLGSPGSNGRTNNFDIYGRMSSSSSSRYQDAFLYNGLGQRVQKLVQSPRVCNQNAMPTRALTQGTQPVAAPAPQAVCTPWQVTGTVRYVYDTEGHLLGEYDSTSGYSQETVWFNGQPVATVQAGKVYYVYGDNLGTPRSAVRASDNVEMWRWDSEPFGSDYPISPNPGVGTLVYNLRFPGQIYDLESQLHYNGLRDYDPFTGRYIEADPLGLGGGLARYTYVMGNPLSLIDPIGLDPHNYTWSVFRCMGNCVGQSMTDLLYNPAPSVNLNSPV